jgi:hypothetical protein
MLVNIDFKTHTHTHTHTYNPAEQLIIHELEKGSIYTTELYRRQ